MRQEFEMSQQQYDKIIETINVARSTPLIMLQCGMPESPQEAANRAWGDLGREMGFDGATVEPSSKGKLFFTAIPPTDDKTGG